MESAKIQWRLAWLWCCVAFVNEFSDFMGFWN